MKKDILIAVTDNTDLMRCRLIVKMIKKCNAVPLLVPMHLSHYISDIEQQNKDNIDKVLEKHINNVEEILSCCDAIILPGNNNDIHPNLYGSDFIHPETKKRLPTDPLNVRQLTEVMMIKYALKNQNISVLGICGGMQLINSVMGGTLVQHLPDDERVTIDYHYDQRIESLSNSQLESYENNFDMILDRKRDNIFLASHEMLIEPKSHLAKIYKKLYGDIDLNKISELSLHHQGCFKDNIADKLKIVATAPDGIVEAVEYPDYPRTFLLTQFHPECNVSGIALELIKELII